MRSLEVGFGCSRQRGHEAETHGWDEGAVGAEGFKVEGEHFEGVGED